jgi:hypothetical protein
MDPGKFCKKCRSDKPLSDFSPIKRKYKDKKPGDLPEVCRRCAALTSQAAARRKQLSSTDTVERTSILPLLSIQELLDQLKQLEPVARPQTSSWDLEARVCVTDSIAERAVGSQGDDEEDLRRQRSDSLMDMIWDAVGYRFV